MGDDSIVFWKVSSYGAGRLMARFQTMKTSNDS